MHKKEMKFWAIYSAIILSFIFSVPMSSADYWTNKPPIQIGEIELSPGATVCVGTEVTLALTKVVDFDTFHYCLEDEKEKTDEYEDLTLRNYWTVTTNGIIYKGIGHVELGVNQNLEVIPDEPGAYRIEVYTDDRWELPPPEGGSRDDPPTATQSVTVTVLKVDMVEVNPENVEVPVGTRTNFTARLIWFGPDGREGTADDMDVTQFCGSTIRWSTKGEGQEEIGAVNPETGATTTFTARDKLPTGVDKLNGHVIATVIGPDGEKIQGKAKVTVIAAYAKLSYIEAVDAKDSTRKSRETLQMASVKLLEKRTATITAYKDKPEMNWAEDEPVWWGLVDNKDVGSVTYTGTQSGKEHARAGNVPKLVTIEIIDGKENKISISTGTFKAFQDILVKVATALKGDKDKVTVSPISGSLKWYKVDQTRSPLCQTTHEFSASPGGFSYGDKFYIPSLSINFRWVKIGIFVEPDLSLKITGIEIIRDGTKNPVEFTKLSGGAGIDGSISGGAGAEFDIRRVISVEADLKGTASAGGDFKVSIPGPKLSGTYAIGEITVSGKVTIEYREIPYFEGKVTKFVWEGITDIGEVDLSSFFAK